MGRKTTITESTQERITVDSEGNVITATTTKESHMLARSTEPDYIKIYTDMWCEFNQIPERVRPLFLQLAMRMSYCNSLSPEESQIVYTGGPAKKALMKAIKITNEKVLFRQLQELVECNAIRRITRGCYQINPQYAGRGAWRYNAKEQQGGIEDLVATFNFREGTVDTRIKWAAYDNSLDAEELGLFDNQQIIAKETKITPSPSFTEEQLPGQLKIANKNLDIVEEDEVYF